MQNNKEYICTERTAAPFNILLLLTFVYRIVQLWFKVLYKVDILYFAVVSNQVVPHRIVCQSFVRGHGKNFNQFDSWKQKLEW